MWSYSKKLQYPVKVKNTNPSMAKIIMTQLGGPDGETGASMRYLHQRYSCPYDEITGVLTDVGTSVPEMLHLAQKPDKPCGEMLLIHTIFTKDRIEKWNADTARLPVKTPYRIRFGEAQRTTRLCVATSKILELIPELDENQPVYSQTEGM